MARVAIREDMNQQHPLSGATVQKPVTLTESNWHAAFSSGAAIADSTPGNFTNPSATSCDRIPMAVAAAGGNAFVLTLTGTWNGAAQTEVKSCATNATNRFTKPFDMITAASSDVDAGSTVTLKWGDAYMDPPARALAVGTGNAITMQLAGETAKQQVTAPTSEWWARRATQIESGAGTTATGLVALW